MQPQRLRLNQLLSSVLPGAALQLEWRRHLAGHGVYGWRPSGQVACVAARMTWLHNCNDVIMGDTGEEGSNDRLMIHGQGRAAYLPPSQRGKRARSVVIRGDLKVTAS